MQVRPRGCGLLACGDLTAQLARDLRGRAVRSPGQTCVSSNPMCFRGGHDELAEQLLELRIALAELYRYSCELVVAIAASASEISAKRPSGVWRGIGPAVHGYSRALPKGMRPVSDQDQASTDRAKKTATPAAVTPSEETQRPAGLAFNVREGADLPGVPIGDQTPKNPHAATTEETGTGAGLAVPGHPRREQEESLGG